MEGVLARSSYVALTRRRARRAWRGVVRRQRPRDVVEGSPPRGLLLEGLVEARARSPRPSGAPGDRGRQRFRWSGEASSADGRRRSAACGSSGPPSCAGCGEPKLAWPTTMRPADRGGLRERPDPSPGPDDGTMMPRSAASAARGSRRPRGRDGRRRDARVDKWNLPQGRVGQPTRPCAFCRSRLSAARWVGPLADARGNNAMPDARRVRSRAGRC
jgi:hypothetical protein